MTSSTPLTGHTPFQGAWQTQKTAVWNRSRRDRPNSQELSVAWLDRSPISRLWRLVLYLQRAPGVWSWPAHESLNVVFDYDLRMLRHDCIHILTWSNLVLLKLPIQQRNGLQHLFLHNPHHPKDQWPRTVVLCMRKRNKTSNLSTSAKCHRCMLWHPVQHDNWYAFPGVWFWPAHKSVNVVFDYDLHMLRHDCIHMLMWSNLVLTKPLTLQRNGLLHLLLHNPNHPKDQWLCCARAREIQFKYSSLYSVLSRV